MKSRYCLLPAMTAIVLSSAAKEQQLEYPVAPSDGTTYEAFGIKVSDNFRPLENDTAAATLAWVKAENRVTSDYLSKISYREGLRQRLTKLNNFAKTGAPWLGNDGLYYFSANDGLRNQSVIYRGSKPYSSDAEVFLDPNKLSDDGTVALTGIFQSKDGRFTAYTISRSGSDWTEIYVMETASKKLLSDHIEWAKFTDVSWNGEGFYYNAYARPEAGKEFSNANEYHKVYFHRLGTPQSDDVVAYENAEQPLYFHVSSITDDGKYLLVAGEGQGFGNSLYVKRLDVKDAEWITVEASQEYEIQVVDTTDDGKLIATTTLGAPKGRVVVIDLNHPSSENWKDLIAEGKYVLSGVYPAGGKLIVRYDQDAAHHAYVYEMDGTLKNEIKFPTYGAAGFSTRRDAREVFYTFASFTYPSNVYSYDMWSGTTKLLKSTEVDGLNSSDYTTEQVFYPSADGTKIPMFIVYKNGLKRDGSNPVYLYGYGGFDISLTPNFTASRILWLENGGVYAQANLRGGGEYGEEWHEAGTKQNKQNVFDDFIAAGEYMIKEGWTNKDMLTIEGGSNGGLLVGACVNQRPDLFRVAIPRVGVMDMMRYHLFTIGWNWASDYGTADDSAEMAKYLLSYSPLHTIKDGAKQYPAIMVTTADHDDRVVPAHSFKYAATLQAANTGDRPKLIRIDSKAGHGAGKPISKVIDEWTDIYSFIFYNLGIKPNVD